MTGERPGHAGVALLLAVICALTALAGCTRSGTGATPAAGRSGRQRMSGRPSPSAPAASRPTAGGSGIPRVRAVTAGWRLPRATSRGAVVPVGGGGVLAGGLLPGDVTTDRSYRVEPSTGRVTRLGNLAVATHDVAGAYLGGAPTVFGGGNTSVLSAVQRLGRDGRWRVAGRLPSPRADLSAAQDGARALVVGGYDGLRSPRAVLATSGGHRFTTAARLPAGVRYAAVAVVGDTAWVFGGEESDRELGHVYRIDLATGSVRARGRMPRPLGHAAAVVVGDRVLLMGGRTTPDRPTDRMWWFDTVHRTWRRAGRLPYPVADAPTLATPHHAFLLGGETPDFTDRVVRVTWRAR